MSPSARQRGRDDTKICHALILGIRLYRSLIFILFKSYSFKLANFSVGIMSQLLLYFFRILYKKEELFGIL